jgi:hypothetical protein
MILVAAGSASAQYSFEWTFEDQGAVKIIFELQDFLTEFTNTSAVTDSFRLNLVKDMPATWQATLCEGPTCYPPTYTEHTFELGPGESTNLDFAITALDEGKGTSTVTIYSLSDPGVTATNSFTIITSGLDVLTVDADGGADYETYFMDSIVAAGRTTADWTRSYMGSLTPEEIAYFDAVVWVAGTNGQSLDETERANLKNYVFNNGNLFLSGQDLARDFCDPGSPYYTAESHAWFQDLLGVDYLADHANTSTVAGVSGDPVSDGLNFAINGGDGANNNTSPDAIEALSNGAISLVYSNDPTAGVRGAYGDGRTFFAAFGFEGISTATDRDGLMVRILDWITNPFNAVGDDFMTPLVSRAYVTPNPFNPQTNLKFEVGGELAVDGSVVIYDLRGRAVRELYRGPLEPGLRTMIWNGKDNRGRGLASGIYLAQVKVADQTQTVKMTLAR